MDSSKDTASDTARNKKDLSTNTTNNNLTNPLSKSNFRRTFKQSFLKLRKNSGDNQENETTYQDKLDQLYGSFSDSGSNNSATPVGLFGLFSSSAPDKGIDLIIQNKDFFEQFSLFQQLFPDFPTKLTRSMVLRFSGNFKEITNYLIQKGWSPDPLSIDAISQLKNINEIHFITQYFIGPQQRNMKKYLHSSPPFSYYTYFTQTPLTEYYVQYKTENNRIVTEKIKGPNVTESELTFLVHPLKLPRDTTATSFLPFLFLIE